jgi:PKHD-type hydroxylase
MKSEWCYFKQYFNKNQCAQILEDGLKLPVKRADLGVDGESRNEEYRRSNIRFIQKDNTQFEWLFDIMWKMAIQANHDWFNFNLTKLDYLQLAEYDSADEGEYKRHHDVFWLNNTDYHRKLSAVVQLSDPNDYTGGELKLFNQNETINAYDIKQQGTTIFFPSFVEHQAEKVTTGKRYSLAAWFDGPHWT